MGRVRLCLRNCLDCKIAKDAGKKLLDLISGGHRQVCGPETQENSIETVCKRIQNEEAR